MICKMLKRVNWIQRATNLVKSSFYKYFEFKLNKQHANFAGDILEYMASKKFFNGKLTRWEEFVITDGILLIVLGLFLMIGYSFYKWMWLKTMLLIIGSILFLSFLFPVIELIKMLTHPFYNFIELVENNTDEELKLIEWLQTYTIWQLEYVAGTVESHCQYLQGRGEVIFGSVSKLGIIPICATTGIAIFSFYQINEKFLNIYPFVQDMLPSVCAIIAGCFMGFVIHAYNIRNAKRIIFLIKQAIACKQS